jgi:hypothetical protein
MLEGRLPHQQPPQARSTLYQLPPHFRQNLTQYRVRCIHFLPIFCYLMAKVYDLLANHFVEITYPKCTEQEVITLLRTHTQRLPRLAA